MKKTKLAVIILSILLAVETLLLIRFWPAPHKNIFKKAWKAKGVIAIVLDDWGYNFSDTGLLDGIRYPLTISVLPNLSYSQAVSAQLGRKKNREIILHLPLEPQPYEKYRLEHDTISVAMDTETAAAIVRKDLDTISYARGVSNHMGSLATADPRIMAAVYKELKKRKLYFLDSLVSHESVCASLARRMGVRFAQRDIFLDNKPDPEYILRQLNRLKVKAQDSGSAIGIGHDRKLTLKVLQEAMPQLEAEGFKFVFVSDLAR